MREVQQAGGCGVLADWARATSERNCCCFGLGCDNVDALYSVPFSFKFQYYYYCLCCTGVSAAFAVKLFKSWINEKDINAVAVSLRKVNMDNRLMVSIPKTTDVLHAPRPVW